MSDESLSERVTDLEVALSFERRLVEELNGALTAANAELTLLGQRVQRLERLVESLVEATRELPPNEKPPHY